MILTSKEKTLYYEYFIAKITALENEYILVNNNMRRKSYRLCDEVDFLELMMLKSKLDFLISLYQELSNYLKL